MNTTEFLEKLLSTRAGKANIESLADASLDAFGPGPQGLTKLMRKEFDAAKEGSIQRTKLLGIIGDWIKQASSQRKTEDPMKDLSKDELQRAIQEAVKDAESVG